MKRHSVVFVVLVVLGLTLSACNLPSRAGQATPDLFATLAATAGIPINFTNVPSVTTVPVENTVAAATVQPAVTAQPTAANTSQPTSQAPITTSTPVPTIQTGGTPIPRCTYLATFVADVTVPDDAYMNPGQAFTKVWRVRNDGTCAWGAGYPLNALIFYNGNQFGAPYFVPISGTVGAGQMLDISVNMVAPNTSGVYTSEWMFSLDNTYFGLGPSQAATLYTRIVVGPTPRPTRTPLITTRLNLPAGATAISVDSAVAANGIRSFILSAGKGQLLMASISSSVSDLTLQIVDASNMQILAGVDGPEVQAILPHNGDYLVQIVSYDYGADFTLGVTIPARISFAPGAISATVDGQIVNHFATTYLLRAMAGQNMDVTVTAPSGAIAITIYGLSDGQPLVRSSMGLTNWSGTLPATQDYVIMVVPSVNSAYFTLTATVE